MTLALLLSKPDSVGDVMGPLWATIIGVTVHLGFWVTLVFAFIERGSKGNDGVFEPWTPDSLPELPQRGEVKLGDALGSAVFLITMVAFVVWQQFWPVVRPMTARRSRC